MLSFIFWSILLKYLNFDNAFLSQQFWRGVYDIINSNLKITASRYTIVRNVLNQLQFCTVTQHFLLLSKTHWLSLDTNSSKQISRTTKMQLLCFLLYCKQWHPGILLTVCWVKNETVVAKTSQALWELVVQSEALWCGSQADYRGQVERRKRPTDNHNLSVSPFTHQTTAAQGLLGTCEWQKGNFLQQSAHLCTMPTTVLPLILTGVSKHIALTLD